MCEALIIELMRCIGHLDNARHPQGGMMCEIFYLRGQDEEHHQKLVES